MTANEAVLTIETRGDSSVSTRGEGYDDGYEEGFTDGFQNAIDRVRNLGHSEASDALQRELDRMMAEGPIG